MLKLSTYVKDLTLTHSVLNETVIIQLLLKYSLMVLLWTAAVVPGCLHWPPQLWRLPLCAAVARGGSGLGPRAVCGWSLRARWLRAAAVVSGLVSCMSPVVVVLGSARCLAARTH